MPTTKPKREYDDDIAELLPDLIEFRHDLHMHPELAFQERRTSARLMERLSEIPGLSIRNGIADTGIVATLNVDKPGPCVALRADMDALPIQEANTFPYRSQHEGVMHACGHDGHTTCLLGAAQILARCADKLPGKVKFIFQPGEEHGAGGKVMVEEGALEDPIVDAAYALHGWPQTEVGSIVIGAGPILSAATAFEIELRGEGTHAAYPHMGTDIILAASHLISAMQAVRTRFVNPLEPVVVSITSFRAGNTHNVLPERGKLLGTVRTLTQETHEQVFAHLERLASEVLSELVHRVFDELA